MAKKKSPAAPATPEIPKHIEPENTIVPQKDSMKRLTIDIPENLHRKLKAQCAMEGQKIADAVRKLLERKYDNP